MAIAPDTQAFYRGHAAMGGSPEGGENKRVRAKDPELRHPGPVTGGLPDFFQNAAGYASPLEQLADAPERCARFGAFNHADAERHFAAGIAADFIVSNMKQYLHWDKESIS